ncbi:MAG: winged helix-turn-helix transcriptional regulator [Firmicutes bacterium]|nr:winged helix-turn-helix transcriptional regulator [Bacillota bacterium]MBQ5797851.1 winged helix-turn-helix transcriptional regulator [Bacillota bacterium]MBR7149210.1 winged helix-turn-helix transcriptional regulator [Bacillota bacterium]
MQDRFQAFVTGISVCYKYIQKIKSVEMTEFGLKGAHAMCLFFLHSHPEGLTAAQLSQLCAEDKAAVSRSLASLADKGYIESDEKKYRSRIRLTEQGKQVAFHIDEMIERWVESGGDGLTEQDREIFYNSLELISNNLRDHLEEM